MANIVKINFIRTLEMNDMFAAIQKAFIQENWLIWFALFPYTPPQLSSGQPETIVKTRSLAEIWGGGGRLQAEPDSFKATFPENCHWLTCLVIL